MKRKMIGATAAYIAGLFFASFFMGAIPFLLISLAVLLIGKSQKLKVSDYILIAVSFSAAFAVSSIYTRCHYDKIIAYDGKTGTFSGEVIDIRRFGSENELYILKGSLYDIKNVRIGVFSDDVNAEFGDTITLRDCEFSVIDGDYLFNGRNYYRSEKIYLTAVGFKSAEVAHMHSHRMKRAIIEYRDSVVSKFRIVLGDDVGDFLAGMVFGEKQGIDDSVKTSLYRCGIGHVLAVSGLHVSIIAIAMINLMRLLRVNRFISFLLMDLLLIILVVMANSPMSAIRAAIMMNFAYSAHLFRRRSDPFNSLAASMLLICLINPYAVYSSGLILSAAGTFGIGVFAPFMTKKIPKNGLHWRLFRSFCTMLCTTVCIMPFSMKFFEETSLIAPIVNVFVVPLCSVSMIIGVIYIISGGLISLLGIAGMLIRFILTVSEYFSKIGSFYFSCRSDRLAVMALAAIALVAFIQIIFGKRFLTASVAALSCSLLFISSAVYGFIFAESFTVAVLGRRGNAVIVISYHGKTDIIDLSGHYKSPDYVRKYMLENGIGSAEFLMLTKKNQSQYAAYEKKLEAISIKNVFSAGDIPIACVGDEAVSGEGEWHINGGDRIIEYSDGALRITFGEARVAVVPWNDAHDYDDFDGLRIIYGENSANIEDDFEIFKNIDANTDNFEITLTEIGEHKIRRL